MYMRKFNWKKDLLDMELVEEVYASTNDTDWTYSDGGIIKYYDDVRTGWVNTPPVRVYNLYG